MIRESGFTSSSSSAFPLILCTAFFECILHITAVYRAILGPAIPTSAYLPVATLGASWVYWPSSSDFDQAQRSPSQATHVSHLGGIFYLFLHRHKIQGTTDYCPIRWT
jgi:hypothetical protein